MPDAFILTLAQTVRIFMFIAVGYLFNKTHILPKSAEGVVSKLAIILFNPMLTVYTFSQQCTPEKLRGSSNYILYGAAMFGLAIFTAYLMTPMFTKNPSRRGLYHYALGMPNTGTFRTPLVLALFGAEGYFVGSLYNLSATILTYTWGMLQFKTGPHKKGIGYILKKLINPNTIALLVGALLGLTGTVKYIPDIVMENVKLLGDGYVPMALFAVGMFVADYHTGELLPTKRTLIFTGWRMILLPIIMVLLLKLINAPDMVIILTALSFSCPCGMYTVIFPAANGESTHAGVNMVVFTSIVAVVIIPLIYSFTCSIL